MTVTTNHVKYGTELIQKLRCLHLEDMFGILTPNPISSKELNKMHVYFARMKHQFVITQTIRRTEILALLDSRVTNTFYQNICKQNCLSL
jgi:hypothetical protein